MSLIVHSGCTMNVYIHLLIIVSNYCISVCRSPYFTCLCVIPDFDDDGDLTDMEMKKKLMMMQGLWCQVGLQRFFGYSEAKRFS